MFWPQLGWTIFNLVYLCKPTEWKLEKDYSKVNCWGFALMTIYGWMWVIFFAVGMSNVASCI